MDRAANFISIFYKTRTCIFIYFPSARCEYEPITICAAMHGDKATDPPEATITAVQERQ